ncbi:MAG: hypothetical protein QNJ13_00005, partial [Paracoccaceae bacterium]|nr:hypothetical protein [Paracoccaceae bacterium]
GITETVQRRLARWRTEQVQRAHFPGFPSGLPHVEEQLHIPVLDGLSLLPRGPSKQSMAGDPTLRAQARRTLDELVPEFRKAASKAIGHRRFLRSVG